MFKGTCCSDYNNCETYVPITSSEDNCRSISNCYLCNTRTNTCGQCESNYYLLNGKCVSSCGSSQVTVFNSSRTCYDTTCKIKLIILIIILYFFN